MAWLQKALAWPHEVLASQALEGLGLAPEGLGLIPDGIGLDLGSLGQPGSRRPWPGSRWPVFYRTLSPSGLLPCFLSLQFTIMQSRAMGIADHILPLGDLLLYYFTALKFVPVLKLLPPGLVTWIKLFLFLLSYFIYFISFLVACYATLHPALSVRPSVFILLFRRF